MLAVTIPNQLELHQEDDEMTKIRRKRGRALQVSMPNETDQYALLILASVSGCSVSDLIRAVLEPYIDFTTQIIEEEGYLDEWGQFAIDPDKVVQAYEKKKNTQEYLLKMQEEIKATGLKFPFVKPSRLY